MGKPGYLAVQYDDAVPDFILDQAAPASGVLNDFGAALRRLADRQNRECRLLN